MGHREKDKIRLIPARIYSHIREDFLIKDGVDDNGLAEHSFMPVSQLEEGIEEAEKAVQELKDILHNHEWPYGMVHSERAIEAQHLIEDILVFMYLSRLGGEDFNHFVDTYLPLYRQRWEREGR